MAVMDLTDLFSSGILLPSWFAVPAALFAALWLAKAAQISFGSASVVRQELELQGNLLRSYRERLKSRLQALAIWIDDGHIEKPAFTAKAFVICLAVASVYPAAFETIAAVLLGQAVKFADLHIDGPQSPGSVVSLATLSLPAVIGTLCLWAGRSSRFAFVAASLSVLVVLSTFYLLMTSIGGNDATTLAIVFLFAVFTGPIGFAMAFLVVGRGAFAYAAATSLALGLVLLEIPTDSFIDQFPPPLFFGSLVLLTLILSAFIGWVLSETAVAADDRRIVGAFVASTCALLLVPPLIFPYIGTEHAMSAMGPEVLLFGLLPIVNAPIDWLSLGITRRFLGALSHADDAELAWLHVPLIGPLLEAFLIGLNVLIAICLATIIAVATAGFTALYNQMHVWSRGHDVYDVPAMIDRLLSDPGSSDWWWLYAMMGWTLIPTLVHLVAFAGMIVTSPVAETGVGTRLSEWVRHAREGRNVLDVAGSSFCLVVLQLLPFIGLAILGYEFRHDILDLLQWMGPQIASWARIVAEWIHGL